MTIAAAGWAWSGDAGRFAVVLVLATPCPLLIAPPVVFLAGMSRASRSGIIIRGGDVLERLAEFWSVALDKTGTLTSGEPSLVEVRPEPPHTGEEVQRWAAWAERYSSHGLAHSVIEPSRDAGPVLETAHAAQEQATNGVTARLPSGEVLTGRRSYVGERTLPAIALTEDLTMATWPWRDDDPADRLLCMLDAMAERVGRERHHMTIRREGLQGHPVDGLIRLCETADLVGVAARGHGAIAGMLLGSVSRRLINHSHRSDAVLL